MLVSTLAVLEATQICYCRSQINIIRVFTRRRSSATLKLRPICPADRDAGDFSQNVRGIDLDTSLPSGGGVDSIK